MKKMMLLILAAILFCLIHSFTASLWFKGWVKRKCGEKFYQRYYTLIYSGIAVINLWWVLSYSRIVPNHALWQIEPVLLIRLVQGLGLGILVWGIMAFDVLEFFGINQLLGKKTPKKTGYIRSLLSLSPSSLFRHHFVFVGTTPYEF